MKKKKLLWIEDDSYTIKGLFRPLKKTKSYDIDIATSALEGYEKAQEWGKYSMIIVDLIIPLRNTDKSLPDLVITWGATSEYVGIELAKWLKTDLAVTCPIMLLSVVPDPIEKFDLSQYGIQYYLSKSGLLPSRLKKEIISILKET